MPDAVRARRPEILMRSTCFCFALGVCSAVPGDWREGLGPAQARARGGPPRLCLPGLRALCKHVGLIPGFRCTTTADSYRNQFKQSVDGGCTEDVQRLLQLQYCSGVDCAGAAQEAQRASRQSSCRRAAAPASRAARRCYKVMFAVVLHACAPRRFLSLPIYLQARPAAKAKGGSNWTRGACPNLIAVQHCPAHAASFF